MTRPHQLIIFDWEGTLGDSVDHQLIPGAREFVEKLHQTGKVLAIATNKRNSSLFRDLQENKLEQYFQVTRSANQTAPKPDPMMLEEILMETGFTASEALMIGDSESDMEMACALGIEAMGIDLSGQHGASLRLAGAKMVFCDYVELWHFFFGEK